MRAVLARTVGGRGSSVVTRLMMGDQAQAVSEQIVWFPPLSGNLFGTLALASHYRYSRALTAHPSGAILPCWQAHC